MQMEDGVVTPKEKCEILMKENKELKEKLKKFEDAKVRYDFWLKDFRSLPNCARVVMLMEIFKKVKLLSTSILVSSVLVYILCVLAFVERFPEDLVYVSVVSSIIFVLLPDSNTFWQYLIERENLKLKELYTGTNEED